MPKVYVWQFTGQIVKNKVRRITLIKNRRESIVTTKVQIHSLFGVEHNPREVMDVWFSFGGHFQVVGEEAQLHAFFRDIK